jgi:hypothetical protein
MRLRSGPVVVAACVAVLAAPAVVPAANPGSAPTSTGQTLNVRIDAPGNGARVPAAALDVTGVAGLGPLSSGSGQINLIYVLDGSGSTTGAAGSGDCNGDGAANASDDANADGSPGTILDCEIFGVNALNDSVASSGAQAGVVLFGTAADLADVGPAAGQQDLTGVATDANRNGQKDIAEVARSITSGSIKVFTEYTNSGGSTDFDSALAKVNAALSAHAGQRNIVFFLSDGGASIDAAAGSALDNAKKAGTRVDTFSVGAGGSGCTNSSSSLKTIADTTGGSCTDVQDPTRLSGSLTGAANTGLKSVQVSVNGGAATTATLGGLGAWALRLPASALRPGTNSIVATATADDGTRAAANVSVAVGSATGAFTPSSVLTLPSTKICTSRRLFPIRIRQVRGVRYDYASVYVNGKRVKVYTRVSRRWTLTSRPRGKVLNVKSFRAWVDLRGLVRGLYKVKIVVVATDGRVVTGTRRYHTCGKKPLLGTVPKL